MGTTPGFNVRIPPPMRKAAVARARREGTSYSALIKEWTRAYLASPEDHEHGKAPGPASEG